MLRLTRTNPPSRQDRTALMLAALAGHTQIVEALRAADGIDLNAKDRGGRTARMLANDKGNDGVVAALRDRNE